MPQMPWGRFQSREWTRDDVWRTDSKIRAGATARQCVVAMRVLQRQYNLSALRVTKSAVGRLSSDASSCPQRESGALNRHLLLDSHWIAMAAIRTARTRQHVWRNVNPTNLRTSPRTSQPPRVPLPGTFLRPFGPFLLADDLLHHVV